MFSYFSNIFFLFFSFLVAYVFMGFTPYSTTLVLVMVVFLSVLYPTNTEVSATFILITMFFCLFNWIIVSLSGMVWEVSSKTFAALPKAIAVPVMILVTLQNVRVRKFFPMLFVSLFTIIVLVSVFRASDKGVAVNYLINTFIPYVVLISFLIFDIKQPREKLFYHYVVVAIWMIIVLNGVFILFEMLGLFSSLEIYSLPGSLFRAERNAWYGNYITTFIDGSRIRRYPGIFADPILAGYFWSGVYSFTLVIRKKQFLTMKIMALIFVLLTFSKGAYFMILLAFALNTIMYLESTKTRKKLIVFSSVLSVIFLIFTSLREGNIDSSAIHVLGLFFPFIAPINMEYIIGADLGIAGNLGGWVNQGAESFVGMLKYATGIVGVLFFIIHIFLIIKEHNKKRTLFSRFVIISIVPVFIASFLQENSFNLAYTFPKLVFLLALVSYQGSCNKQEETIETRQT